MAYALGIDLGTTYSTAAVSDGDRLEIVQLGSRISAVPSVVLLREDGEVLTGEAAERRAITESSRTAREFKRRLGDPTPLLLGGTPYAADALLSYLLKAVYDQVVEREGADQRSSRSHIRPATGRSRSTSSARQLGKPACATSC